ncbi:peroxisomal biogenesis factor 11 [Geranomyces variabilis]|nr:peroxisomal biogenesis factor 11 [Geranomyces variabilis]KAJ3137468.1 Peroxisomal membrane protein PMP27 [Geranomyces variabilis]
MSSAVYSPQLHEHIVKYLATSVGRDRIHRFVQYFSRFLVWHGQRNGYEKETLQRLTNLMNNLGSTRKLMRVGRQFEFIRTIQKAASMKDDVARITITVKNVFLALWLLCDSCSWANSAGVIKFDNIKEISRRGQKAWLVALIASLLNNLHKLRLNTQRIEQETKAVHAAKTKGVDELSSVAQLKTLRSERTKLAVAAVADSLDIMIPASGLDLIPIESGIVGLIGATTAIIGGVNQWNATA